MGMRTFGKRTIGQESNPSSLLAIQGLSAHKFNLKISVWRASNPTLVFAMSLSFSSFSAPGFHQLVFIVYEELFWKFLQSQRSPLFVIWQNQYTYLRVVHYCLRWRTLCFGAKAYKYLTFFHCKIRHFVHHQTHAYCRFMQNQTHPLYRANNRARNDN